MEYNKEVGLNNYEKFFFRRVFGTNLKRLMAFRKAVMKRQNDHGDSYTCEQFSVKGGKWLRIYISKKKVDAYIKLIKNEE
jgi:predicted enzyme related to lactoylglutathione lyase